MDVKDYLEQDITIRQKHLRLDENCIERGGGSPIHRGVLSQYLNCDIYGRPADLCHACHNPKCSNPRHLYWGTRSENVKDSVSNGTHKNGWSNMVEKYGEEEARNILRNKAKEHHKKMLRNNETHPHSNTIYVNNGIKNKRIDKNSEIPQGWKRGRLEYIN